MLNSQTGDQALRSSSIAVTPNQFQIEDDGVHRNLSFATETLYPIGSNAFAASQSEHRMTFRQGLRLYPKAIAWSAVISLAIVMEGYDTALINSIYAFKEFQRHYGVLIGKEQEQYQITSKWQAALSNGATAGSIIGLFANGLITERFRYRYTMMGALLLLAAFISLSFFAFNIQTLLVSQILCGLPWGFFSALTTTYAAEIMPLNLRAYLTSIVNFCWLLGQITALAILRALINWHSAWSYRIPFGLQWMWIMVVLICTLFAPESPWRLIQHNRKAEAERVLQRLTRRNLGFNAANTIVIMEHANNAEKHSNTDDNNQKHRFGDSSYFECLRGRNLRHTEIACMIGFNEIRSFDLTMGMHGLAILGSLVSLVLMRYFGRRTSYSWGLTLCLLILVVAGTIGTLPETSHTLWAIAGLLITFIFVFDTAVGPVTYCLVAEIPSTRLRVKTVVLARVAYNVSGIVINILIQRMLNPSA